MKKVAEHKSVTLFWILVLTVFILMSGFTAIRFTVTKRGLDDALERRAENVALRIVDAISPTIWDIYRKSEHREYSKEVSSAVLDAEFRDSFVLGVVVYGNFGHVHMARFRGEGGLLDYDQALERKIREEADLTFYEPIKNGPMTIGNVRVYLSSLENRNLIEKTLIVDVAEALAVSVLIVVCLFFILRKALIAPMRKLGIASHVIDSLREAVVVTDGEGRVVDANPYFCRLVGKDKSELLGSALGLGVECSEGVDTLIEIWKGAAAERVWTGEARISWADGQRMDVYANVSPVVFDGDVSDYTVTVLQGIEELKQAEEALKLRNRELELAKDRAEASSRAKDEFLSIMSHELRTPLNPIIGFGSMINDELEDPEQLEQMGVVLNSATHLLRLIESVLEYTKLERDPSQCEVTVFDYKASCETLLNSVRTEAESKSLGLSFAHHYSSELEAGEGCFEIVCDKAKFEQVVHNSLVNAIKFTSAGSVSIETLLSPGLLRVSVRDTGLGIGGDDLERIFQAFTQVDSSLRRKHQGIGLGLAICRKLAVAMGGEVGCESELGKGSVFWLEIPVDVERSGSTQAPR
ncbi:ATP-binding protein [Pelagicoccus sp. SDUM812005]|uniref:PAS domain-containing sensor histidine kinase n=1 Tax=Pelagicoccus sp. SDUM812005 TaxID=3041257 RepID=UPI00280EAE23|nr:ATP-binding protein [Pelagicoccus sp. SDUM812005]MDQ8182818.1 ATP-binding protein [Pelagicoccus sp. SDUM812005]